MSRLHFSELQNDAYSAFWRLPSFVHFGKYYALDSDPNTLGHGDIILTEMNPNPGPSPALNLP